LENAETDTRWERCGVKSKKKITLSYLRVWFYFSAPSR
jgi:hypothetical protein